MTCPRCQELEILLHPQLRNSRFDFNARYIRFDEAEQVPEFQAITKALQTAKNFEPYPVANFTFYRRGTGGLWLYVVPTCDFRVPRERKNHNLTQKEHNSRCDCVCPYCGNNCDRDVNHIGQHHDKEHQWIPDYKQSFSKKPTETNK